MAASPAVVIKQIKIPASYNCVITGQIMVDPVFAADGHTYEREAIEKWLETHDTSPKTNLKLKHKELVENHDKRGDILEFLREYPEFYEKEEVYLPKSLLDELTAAIKANKIKEVQEYLAKDRRLLTLKLKGDYTAFHLAAQFGSTELTNILLESLRKKAALDKISSAPAGFKPLYLNKLLEQSLIKGDKDKFSLLLKLGAELNQVEENTHNTLLHRLAIQGNPEPIQWLLERGLTIDRQNREGDSPLLLAVQHGQVKLTEVLVKAKANPHTRNNQKQSAVSIVLEKQNLPLLSLLVGPEKAALPPLHLALALNDLESIKTLLKQVWAKTALQTPNQAGHTPFYVLMAKDTKEMKEKEEAAQLLLEAGADPTVACGAEKLTALHLVAKQGDLTMLKFLLKTKAVTSIDAEDVQGNTPLHLAASTGQNEVVVYLLEAGADHEARNQQGQTPTELAKSQNQAKTAVVIVQKVRMMKRAQSEGLQRLCQGLQEQTSRLEQVEKELAKEKAIVKKQANRIEQLEKEVTALKQKLSPAEEKERKEKEEQRGPAPSFLSQYQAQSKPRLKVTAEEVQKFLDYIAAGAQPEAEVMLKKNPELALASGTVTDHAKRTFKNITGFQYAVWALDWQMWTMIKSYLPKKAAQEQSKGFGEGAWVAEYGEHIDWKKLIEKQQTLIDNFLAWSWEKVDEYWVKQIGGTQLLLPMHVLQEYNQPGRPFDPCPKFDAEYVLSRALLPTKLSRMGKEVMVLRGSVNDGSVRVAAQYACAGAVRHATLLDQRALDSLYRIRTQQRVALITELIKNPDSNRPSK